VACTDTSDREASLESLDSLSVTGNSVQQNAVILELGSGEWSHLLATPESIQVSLGQGENSLVVSGTGGPDLYHHGMRGLDLVLDLVGDGRIGVVAAGVTELGISLGDGDDRLDDLALLLAPPGMEGSEAEPAPTGSDGSLPILPLSLRLVASGGVGNDWLLGGSADDAFDGGPGDDVASGLAGDDTFLTADTNDGADTFNGALGYDTVSYELRSNAVVLDVCSSEALLGCNVGECDCAATSGETGESDRLLNVEDITGGKGDDILRGSDAAESLSGGVGDDSLYGLGGSDILYGQSGGDLFDGGLDGDYCDAQPQEQSSGCEL
jgi:Ca2+-binding RTX toxin-like protein